MERPLVVAVIGAGAAGLVAAAEAAARGASVLLIEKNSKLGVKILMSGGTRCNLTHHTDSRGIAKAFGHAERFLQPSLGAFSPADVVQMFEDLGVATKVESTGKVFPVSNRAVHVRDALVTRAERAGVQIEPNTTVRAIEADRRWQIATTSGPIEVDRVIVTSGGKSWPGCGTTGDGYAWLRHLGHSIVNPRPALVPLTGGDTWMHELSGVAIEDCVANVVASNKGGRRPLIKRRGAWLFTHFGFSGPAAMDISGVLTAADSFGDTRVFLDLVPDWDELKLRATLTDRGLDGGRRRIRSILSNWLPGRLANALAEQSQANHTVAQLPRRACHALIDNLKRLPIPVHGTVGFEKAEVTAGGVALKEVDPRTMQSRIAPGLFIAGEVLDVDGPIGGYNFQAAFSTGRTAGIAAATR